MSTIRKIGIQIQSATAITLNANSMGLALDCLARDVRNWQNRVDGLGPETDLPEDIDGAIKEANALVDEGLILNRYVHVDVLGVINRRDQLWKIQEAWERESDPQFSV